MKGLFLKTVVLRIAQPCRKRCDYGQSFMSTDMENLAQSLALSLPSGKYSFNMSLALRTARHFA